MTRALIYTRVSKDSLNLGRSVNEQEAECRAICEREGWDVEDVIIDNDRSASRYAKKARPGWAKVHAAIAAGTVDVLVTWEASRAQRDLGAYNDLRELCRTNKVLWSYSGRTYNMDDESDLFTTGIDALVGEREAGDTRKRILRTVRSQAVKGRPHGRKLYGYRRVYDEATGTLIGQEPDPVEAPVIAEMAARVLAGEPGFRVANDLNDRGVLSPAGARWETTQIKRAMSNPHYAGYRVHQGEVIGDAEWAPIIDRDSFSQLAAIYSSPTRAKFRRGNDVRHLLSGIARCGICGDARLYVGNDRGRPIYVCRERNGHITRSQEHLDAFVIAIVVGILEREDLDLTVDVTDPTVIAARGEAAELRQRLQDATDAYNTGDLTVGTLGRVEADLTPRIADADRRSRVEVLSSVVVDMAGAGAEARWDAATIEQQREVVATLVDVVVKPSLRKRGSRGFDAHAVDVIPKV
jgi:site-specific DNA recombinase